MAFMVMYFKEGSREPVNPCPPGHERDRLEGVITFIDGVLSQPAVASNIAIDAPQLQAISALESLIFRRPNKGFEGVLERVKTVRLSGYFRAPFPVQQTPQEFWLAQLRELRNLVVFAIARLPRRETSKTGGSVSARRRTTIVILYERHRRNRDGYVFPVCADLDLENVPIPPAWDKKLERLGIQLAARGWQGAYTHFRHRVEQYISRATRQAPSRLNEETASAAKDERSHR